METIRACVVEPGRRVATSPLAPALTEREAQVLRLLADGLDTDEVGIALRFSSRTVKNVVHGITEKWCLRNRTHAVAVAVRAGLI